jgi:hypothetical protein
VPLYIALLGLLNTFPTRKNVMKYAFNGVAGCVFQSLSLPGMPVGLYHAKQADMPDGPWISICETHGTRTSYEKMADALEHVFLVNWCQECKALLHFIPLSEQERAAGVDHYRWMAESNVLALRRGHGRGPVLITPAKDHNPVIFQTGDSFVNQFTATLAPYQGCEKGCTFCYVPHILKGLPAKLGGWGNYVRPRFRASEFLEKQAPQLTGARIFFAATTDPYQRIEQKYRLTRSLLESLIEIPFEFLLISTRGALVMRDLDIFTDPRMKHRIEIGISITSDLDHVHAACEGDTASYKGRFAIARKLRDAGVPVRIHAAPLGVHSTNFLTTAADSANWLWVDGAGHGARSEEPEQSLLYSYKDARAIAENAKAMLGKDRVGYGSADFGYRWNPARQGIEAPPARTEKRNQVLVSVGGESHANS